MPINPKYIAGLNPVETEKQKSLIKKSTAEYKKTGLVKERPKVSSEPTKRSIHVINFEKKYGFSVSDTAKVKQRFPGVQVDKILMKGRAAYASGSRPNVSITAWANARLASALTGGSASKVDKDLL